jgi:hypothetical protein
MIYWNDVHTDLITKGTVTLNCDTSRAVWDTHFRQISIGVSLYERHECVCRPNVARMSHAFPAKYLIKISIMPLEYHTTIAREFFFICFACLQTFCTFEIRAKCMRKLYESYKMYWKKWEKSIKNKGILEFQRSDSNWDGSIIGLER